MESKENLLALGAAPAHQRNADAAVEHLVQARLIEQLRMHGLEPLLCGGE